MQVMIWEGYNGEFHTKIKLSKTIAERSYIPKSITQKYGGDGASVGPWVDQIRYSNGKEYEQSRKIVCIEAIGPKKIDCLR